LLVETEDHQAEFIKNCRDLGNLLWASPSFRIRRYQDLRHSLYAQRKAAR
jgi:hypothetical protein